VHLTLNFVSITLFSKAESATIGFIVEPGEYRPERVLFISGFKYKSERPFILSRFNCSFSI